jgi:hypothetical protein
MVRLTRLLVLLCAAASCGRFGFDVFDQQDAPREPDAALAVDAADRANKIFVSAVVPSATAVANADSLCADEASGALLAGTFVALVYRNGSLPAAFLASRGFERLDGLPVADTATQVVDGNVYYPYAELVDGSLVTGGFNFAWTGSPDQDCQGWSSNALSELGLGIDFGTRSPLGSASSSCAQTLFRVICSEVGHRAIVPPPTPQPGRLAFWSRSPFNSPAEADANCQALADGNGRSGTFLAAIGIAGAAPIKRFDLLGAPWVNLDGQPVAATTSEFTALHWKTLVTTFGAEPVSLPTVGSSNLTVPSDPASNCNNWTDHTDNGGQKVFLNTQSMLVSTGSTNCSTYRGSLCLQL